jgi:hypothetical protein
MMIISFIFLGIIIGMAIQSLCTIICEDNGDCIEVLEYPKYHVIVFRWFFIYYAQAWIKHAKKRTTFCLSKESAIEKAQWLARAHIATGSEHIVYDNVDW